jgi:hypothetical protein
VEARRGDWPEGGMFVDVDVEDVASIGWVGRRLAGRRGIAMDMVVWPVAPRRRYRSDCSGPLPSPVPRRDPT